MWVMPTLLVLVFVICCVVQFIAMNRIAFGRSIFISAMFILMSVIVAISSLSVARYVSWFLFFCGYAFLLFMTYQSILRFQRNKHQKHQS